MTTTEQDLAEKTAQRRAEVEEQKKTTATSGEAESVSTTMGGVLETRTVPCGCGEEFVQIQAPRSKRWSPAKCTSCLEAEVAAAPIVAKPEPRYRGVILEDLYAAGVNVWKYQDATIEAFDGSDDPQAIDGALAWLEVWESSPRRRFAPRDWLFLYGAGSSRKGREVTLGKLGNGKTFLAVAMARALIERALLDPRRFLFRTAETILIESEATFKAQSDESEKRLLSFYERPELLVIDDLGVRHDPTPHAVRLFDELTKRREAKATIWTSNLSIPVLASGQTMKRIADRIAGECGDGARYVIEFSGPSRRRQRSMRRTA